MVRQNERAKRKSCKRMALKSIKWVQESL